MTKCEICKEVTDKNEINACPCGKKICDECNDRSIYTDENCCKECAEELRKSWRECPSHEWDEPYENDDGDMISECKKCSMPFL